MRKKTPKIVIEESFVSKCEDCPFYDERSGDFGEGYFAYCNKLDWQQIYDGFGSFSPHYEIHPDCPLETIDENNIS